MTSITSEVEVKFWMHRFVMLHQGLFADQAFPTNLALEGIHLPAVVPLMNIQRVLQLECFVADTTLKGATLRVGSQVRLEIALVGETFPTDVAGEPLVLVLLHMLDEVVLVLELLEACPALIVQQSVGGQRGR